MKKLSVRNRQSLFWNKRCQYLYLEGVKTMEKALSLPAEDVRSPLSNASHFPSFSLPLALTINFLQVDDMVPHPTSLAIARLKSFGCDLTKNQTEEERGHLW